MERDDVATAENVLDGLRLLDAEITEAVAADERVVGDDVHAQSERTSRDLLADPAEADHPEGLPGELDSAPARALPAALLQRRVRLRDVARQRDDQPDRLLRGRDDGRLRSIRDDDPLPRGRIDVDVVHPDPRPPDHLQPLRALDQLAREPRRRADHDRVVAGDDLLERRLRVDVDLEPLAEELEACLGDGLADEHPHRQTVATEPNASSAAGAALPSSTSAPLVESSSSIAVSASAMSSITHVSDVPDPEEPRDEVAMTAGDRDPVAVAQRQPERHGVDFRRASARP